MRHLGRGFGFGICFLRKSVKIAVMVYVTLHMYTVGTANAFSLFNIKQA